MLTLELSHGTPPSHFDVALAVSTLDEVTVGDSLINELKQAAPSLRGMDKESLGHKLTSVIMSKNPRNGLLLLQKTEAFKHVFFELHRCEAVEQNKKYHIHNVFQHCVEVCSLLEEDIVLRWAGLLHDLGKFNTFRNDGNGNITFHKHEVFSTKIAESVLSRFCVPEPYRSKIVFLVSMHMYHYSSEWTDKTLNRFINKVGITSESLSDITYIDLFKLRHADRKSRGLEPITSKQKDFEDRIRKFVLSKEDRQKVVSF